MPDTEAIQLNGISKAYASPGSPEPCRVLKDVSLSVPTGERMAIMGPSGCGKSTLLNIIGALDTPDTGTVRLHGEDIAALKEDSRAALRLKDLGFIFQLHHLLPQCTVIENVMLPTLPAAAGGATQEKLERGGALLEKFRLGDRLHHMPGQLSGGERQRVAVARALINAPRVLLADEPTGALDRESADALTDLLVQLNEEQNLTLVVVTHADRLADRMTRRLQLIGGRLETL
jgi:lipoprotein-releasing system ATP-binding protein